MSTAWRTLARQRWSSLAERERAGLLVAVGIVSMSLLWGLGLAPALRTLRTVPTQLEALDTQWQEMQRLADEVRELRAQPALPRLQAQAALGAAVRRAGEKLGLTQQGERVTIEVNDMSGEALTAWLAEVRVGARMRVIEAQLTRTPRGGYRGKLVLAHGVPG